MGSCVSTLRKNNKSPEELHHFPTEKVINRPVETDTKSTSNALTKTSTTNTATSEAAQSSLKFLNDPHPEQGNNQGEQTHDEPGSSSIAKPQETGSENLHYQADDMATRKPPLRTESMRSREEKKRLLDKHESSLKHVFKDFRNCKNFLTKKNPGDYDYEKVNETLRDKIAAAWDNHKDEEQRRILGDKLAEDKFVETLISFYVLPFNDDTYDIDAVTNSLYSDKEEPAIAMMLTIRDILWNYSDSSDIFAVSVCQTELFQYLINDLDLLDVDPNSHLDKDNAFRSAVGIIHNCARSSAPRKYFRQVEMTKHLKPFLASKIEMIKLLTLLAMAYLIDEEENKELEADDSVFDILLKMISDALESKDHRSSGFNVLELVDGLTALAKEENNKALLVQKKALPVLKSVLMGKSEEEQLAAVEAFRELAFLDDNRPGMTADVELIKRLQQLKGSEMEDLAEASNALCFVLKVIDGATEKPYGERKQTRQHIMISYNWGCKDTIIEIKDRLKSRGYPIWIDVEDMEGSLMDSMSSAVENAALVLVCVSEKYQLSQNCRQEAQYAFTLKKRIIPLIMEEGYTMKGWLAFMLAGILYIDVGKYGIEAKWNELIKDIGDLETTPDEPIKKEAVVPTTTSKPREKPPSPRSDRTKALTIDYSRSSVRSWGPADIDQWLKENQLDRLRLNTVLSGPMLVFLHKLSNKAPEFYYKTLETKLSLSRLEDLMLFSDAMEILPI